MWKDFFYYTKSERRAIVVLLLILAVVFSFLFAFRWAGTPSSESFSSGDAELDSFMSSLQERKQVKKGVGKRSYSKPEEVRTPVVLRPFDPNTADSASLRSLGLSAFVARNILRYRASGGVFRTAESLSRIYGMEDTLFQKLKPYVVIGPAYVPHSDSVSVLSRYGGKDTADVRPMYPAKYPEGTLVSLNEADTSQLVRIPGIGSGLARMIVSYRERLGGFSNIGQLQEIPHVGRELNRWFRLDGGPYRKLRVNRDGIDRLRNHPYMDFYKAKAILEYRRKRGRLDGISQISMFREFEEADISRLSPYFSFD